MKTIILISVLLLNLQTMANAGNPTLEAAAKFVNGVEWRQKSVVIGDFSCHGKQEQAILGTSREHIVVAVFILGLQEPPEVLYYSATSRNPATAVLALEDLDFNLRDFEEYVGYIPPGVLPSKSCKGLNLSDGEIDSAHIYWNHDATRFSDWVL